MTIDIENIFKARARSTWSFLMENGQGCYIPAYQRPYSWDKDNVSRLFEDAVHGMDMLRRREQTVTFLGTLITIHDTKHRTVQPIYRNEVPPRVMTIIDGQQRICTITMTNMVFHDQIRRLVLKFSNKSEAAFKWIADQAQRLLPDLQDSFVFDMRTGDEDYRFYPRVIRAYDDAWSRRESEAKYTSPIARLIWDYYTHVKEGNTTRFRHKPKDESGKELEQHKAISEIFAMLQKEAQSLGRGKSESPEFPDLLDLSTNESFTKAVLGNGAPTEVNDYLKDMQADSLYEVYCETYRLILLSRYMKDRMAFTIVTTESEDDAFDMFEALNTTGEPLTAYETFRPKVIEAETLEKYERSPSKSHMDKIEGYLERFSKAEQKQKATSELLVPFALAESGAKLPSRLNDQRRYLRDQYVELDSNEKKRGFVERLAHAAIFMDGAWNNSQDQVSFSPVECSDNASAFAFAGLRTIKHVIVIAPLIRFFSEAYRARQEDGDAGPRRAAEFAEAVRATAGFSMLWRGAFGGTNNIDSLYREIVRSGVAEAQVKPLAARPSGKSSAVSAVNYKKALRHVLEAKGEIEDKAAWVRKASQVGIYNDNKDVARFLLICASDDSVFDKAAPGLIKRGRSGVASMIRPEVWRDEEFFSVEHIAPRKSDGSWAAGIYEEDNTPHRLGNLILVPREVNATLSNRSWAHKKRMYQLLSAKDEDEFNELKKSCADIGLELSVSAENVLSRARYLSMCESVAAWGDDWGVDIIDRRSERLAELAYDRLWAWLN